MILGIYRLLNEEWKHMKQEEGGKEGKRREAFNYSSISTHGISLQLIHVFPVIYFPHQERETDSTCH